MKNISIKTKLLIIILGVVISVTTILAIQSVITIQSVSNNNIAKYKKEAYEAKEYELENYVSVALNTINTFYQRGTDEKVKKEVSKILTLQTSQLFNLIEEFYDKNKNKLTQKELQEKIKFLISNSKYGKSGYFWINDLDAVIIDHPIKPSLNGKDLSNFKDKNGKRIFFEFAKIAKENGSGYIDYVWSKPGFDTPQPKVSYVKLFKPFNWVIGTGEYVDNVTSKLQKEALQAIGQMRYGKNGYFWINDTQPRMIMHPMKPSLNGKDLSASKDPNGVFLFNEMVNVAQKSTKGGLVKYAWAKPGKEKPQPKFSYVKKFEHWNWIVGTGAYVDDVEDKIVEMQKETAKKINSIIISFIIESIIIILLAMFTVNILVNKMIIKPLNKFEHGILSFLQYINKESTSIEHLDDSSNDEIGKMSSVINLNISKTKQNIDEENQLIAEAKSTMDKVTKGWYDETITSSTSNESLESFKNGVNDMIVATKQHFLDINTILQEYASLDYRNKLSLDGIEKGGVFELLVTDINKLRDTITVMLVENQSNGITLESSAEILLNNVDSLSKSSSTAAVSLEETAASLEQITANISSNNQNVAQMATFANKVTASVENGQNLASQTTSSMDEINNEVIAINDAISVIDQIAFQTNILSLNAAVEAATAGESGKGFAVVAQEVRNLATRSAQAANEIKLLVEKATLKADNGKKIANDMISGYITLNKNIQGTLDLINDVKSATQEQQCGIEQINDAVSSLDQQTQQNAAVALTTQKIAEKTENIAKVIVKSAHEKEFEGKNTF